MQIRPYKNFWYAADGAIFLHKRYRKNIDWEKVKAKIEGEKETSTKVSTEEEEQDKGTKQRSGKGHVQQRKKKKFRPRTGGKFQINEGVR